jgi:hypothetical protein
MIGKSPSDSRFLRSALRIILPTETETELLRAILHSGEEGRRAWQDWCRRAGNPLTAFERMHSAQKGLIPLVHLAVIRNAVNIESAVASFLRAAHFREELRGNAYRRILRETLVALGANGPSPVVLRGCALGDTVYDSPDARHSHGINLLLHDADLARGADRLRSIGFKPARGRQGSRGSAVPLSWRHTAGLPLELHTQLFDLPYYAAPMSGVWSRTRPLPGLEPVASMLAPEDALLHVCGNSAYSATRTSLRWVCDAWLLIARHSELDWKLFLDDAEAMKLGLPLSIMMRYLAEALDASVPAEILASLDALADGADSVACEIAVLGTLGGAHARMRRMIVTAPDWSARFSLLRCLLAPSPACMREIGYAPESWRLPYYYLQRPLVYAAREASRFGARPALALSRKFGRQG